LRISWLIVGMKPSPFVAGKPGGYFAQQQVREARAAQSHLAFTHVEQCSALARR
jgi:hypothetical protein